MPITAITEDRIHKADILTSDAEVRFENLRGTAGTAVLKITLPMTVTLDIDLSDGGGGRDVGGGLRFGNVEHLVGTQSSGSDRFLGGTGADVATDFEQGRDRLDLSRIDARHGTPEHDPANLRFVGQTIGLPFMGFQLNS